MKGCAGPVGIVSTPLRRRSGDLEPAVSGGNECAVSICDRTTAAGFSSEVSPPAAPAAGLAGFCSLPSGRPPVEPGRGE